MKSVLSHVAIEIGSVWLSVDGLIDRRACVHVCLWAVMGLGGEPHMVSRPSTTKPHPALGLTGFLRCLDGHAYVCFAGVSSVPGGGSRQPEQWFVARPSLLLWQSFGGHIQPSTLDRPGSRNAQSCQSCCPSHPISCTHRFCLLPDSRGLQLLVWSLALPC